MCGEENWKCDIHNHNCSCHEHDHNCECEECNCCDDNTYFDWFQEWDIVWEADFQIVDKEELDEMRGKWELWDIEQWNLWDDLVNLWFISKDDDIYHEMKNEWRNGIMYDIDDEE